MPPQQPLGEGPGAGCQDQLADPTELRTQNNRYYSSSSSAQNEDNENDDEQDVDMASGNDGFVPINFSGPIPLTEVLFGSRSDSATTSGNGGRQNLFRFIASLPAVRPHATALLRPVSAPPRVGVGGPPLSQEELRAMVNGIFVLMQDDYQHMFHHETPTRK